MARNMQIFHHLRQNTIQKNRKNDQNARRNHLQRGPIKSKARRKFQISPLDGTQYAFISSPQTTQNPESQEK